ncbi:MAG: sensor histidine kinase [Firmicutes bacterium]|nr:sensor histidine kinase [Bacillota bacterium]
MNFKEFLKGKILVLVSLTVAIIVIELFLFAEGTQAAVKIFTPILIFICYVIGIGNEFYHKKRFYDTIIEIIHKLENKNDVVGEVEMPNFFEGQLIKERLEQLDKSMIENVNRYRKMQQEYIEYIELWIHEVKLPIAASKMIIENNKSPVTKSIDEELDRIADYTEQALFYARGNTVDKDYYVRKCKLEDIVNAAVKKGKNALIANKVKVDIHDVSEIVYTDSKWCVFILHQIIGNSIKYGKEDVVIEIYAAKEEDKIILHIKDNGIGIKKDEVAKVFDKGFVGTNSSSRDTKKSTGVGLHLCKKLCDKLGIKIEVSSKENIGTEVRLIFAH